MPQPLTLTDQWTVYDFLLIFLWNAKAKSRGVFADSVAFVWGWLLGLKQPDNLALLGGETYRWGSEAGSGSQWIHWRTIPVNMNCYGPAGLNPWPHSMNTDPPQHRGIWPHRVQGWGLFQIKTHGRNVNWRGGQSNNGFAASTTHCPARVDAVWVRV